jgi:hypothetical protein
VAADPVVVTRWDGPEVLAVYPWQGHHLSLNLSRGAIMPSEPTTAIRNLTTDECWQRLSEHPAKVGRVGTGGPSPDILPVNYAVDERSLVFRTAEGK